MKMITIYEIAKLAKVSPATVSRALRNSPKISTKTKEKIWKIAKELDYVPNITARELSSQKTTTVGFVYPSIGKTSMDSILQGVEDSVAKKEFRLLSFNSRENLKLEYEYLKFLHEKRVEGILLVPVITDEGNNLPYLKSLIKNNVPVVMVDRYFPEFATDCVTSDNFAGTYEAVAHLIKLGHRRIGYISGQKYLTSVHERLEGYKKALQDHGIEYRKELVKETTPRPVLSVEESYRAAKEFLDMKNRPTAIFTYNEIATVGALKAIREHNINVPEELSFVGFDEVTMISHIFMPLTAVKQQTYKMGQIGVRMLVERIEHLHEKKKEFPEIRHVSVKTELLIRDSCGARLKDKGNSALGQLKRE